MEIAVPQSNSILMSMPATRFSGIGRWAALAVVGVTLLASAVFILLAMSYQPPDKAPTASRGDLAVYDRIIDRMHHGEGYYPAAHAELLAGHYGTLSVFNWRLPLLSLIVNASSVLAGFAMYYLPRWLA